MLISFGRFSFTLKHPLVMVPLLIPACAMANNGFNLVGYGSESVSMGGANAAMANSPFAVNSNPAGLAQISGQVLDLSVTGWLQRLNYSDQFNDHKDVKSTSGGWGAGGYARQIEGTPFTAGIAAFIQGGSGWVYKNMNSPFGTRDEATSLFAVLKLSPGIGWKVNDALRIGTSLGINYASGSQTLFPNTSTPTFAGINFKDAGGFALSGRLGLQYQPSDDVTFAVDYGTRTKFQLKGGTLRANFTGNPAIGSIVRYDDAQLKGFRLPQELTVGVAFRPIKPLLVSVEETWYDWSEVIKDFTVVAKSARSTNPAVPSTLVLSSNANFRDQHVIKFGLRYDYDGKTQLSLGGNYGRRAIPDQNIGPTFAPTQAPHYMFGIKRKIDDEWSATGIVEFLPLINVTYTNATGLWGANSQQNHTAVLFHLAASRRW